MPLKVYLLYINLISICYNAIPLWETLKSKELGFGLIESKGEN